MPRAISVAQRSARGRGSVVPGASACSSSSTEQRMSSERMISRPRIVENARSMTMFGWRSRLRIDASIVKSLSASARSADVVSRHLAATGVPRHRARWTTPKDPPPMRAPSSTSRA